jgi:hypothetical protein
METLSFEEAVEAEAERLAGLEEALAKVKPERTAEGRRIHHHPFHRAYVSRSLYADQLEHWLAVFRREQLLVLRSEDFLTRPDEIFAEVFAFIGVRPWQVPGYEVRNVGSYAPVDPALRAPRADVRRAERRPVELLGQDFSWASVTGAAGEAEAPKRLACRVGTAGALVRLAGLMAVQLIHVSKAGGSVLRYAIREARRTNGGKLESQWGPIWGHNHLFRISDLEPGDMAVFALRDPITRFVSGFYSRLREGAPRYHIRHTPAERRAFEWFPTPQALADSLAEKRGKDHRRATIAMDSIGHVKRRMTFWTGKPDYLRGNLDRILYIARQETLSEDWEKLKELLDMPREVMLSGDDTIAHRTAYVGDRTINEKGTRALRKWYAEDYELLAIADQFRAGTVQRAPARLSRIAALRGAWDRRRSAAAG